MLILIAVLVALESLASMHVDVRGRSLLIKCPGPGKFPVGVISLKFSDLQRSQTFGSPSVGGSKFFRVVYLYTRELYARTVYF